MLICPIKGENLRISQKFGNKFMWKGEDYYAKYGLDGHNGIDFAVPTGTEIIAPFDGIVRVKDSGNKSYGLHIRLENRETGRHCVLAHLSKVNVKTGDYIYQGDKIAESGNSGGSSGPHLHYGFRHVDKNGKVLNYNNGFLGYKDISGATLLLTGKKLSEL